MACASGLSKPMSYSVPRYSPLGSMCCLYKATHLRHSASFSALSTRPPGGSGSEGCSVSFGQVNLVEGIRSEEHTSELQSLMRISYAVFCLKKKNITIYNR